MPVVVLTFPEKLVTIQLIYFFNLKKLNVYLALFANPVFGIRCSVFDKRKKSFTERRMPNTELRVRNTGNVQTLKNF
jgi:hypothetical protein